jgi:hypothetical protein
LRRRKNVREKTNLEIMSSAFIAEQVLFCCTGCRRNFLRDERILAQKKRRVGVLQQKNFRARALSNRDFLALSSVEVLTAARSVQLCATMFATMFARPRGIVRRSRFAGGAVL